jgi:seryl-tRNA synthetase
MSDALAGVYGSFLRELVEHRLLIPSGVRGVYGRGTWFEKVVQGIDRFVDSVGGNDGAEWIRFPPLVTRRNLEISEYMDSFPDLAGIVHSFAGTERDHLRLKQQLAKGEDWSAALPHADVALTPAACYPIYPTLKGTLPEGGRRFDVQSYCFRHEPSDDPARMQMFRQREHVRIGDAAHVREFRDLWRDRGERMLKELGLECWVDVANDPFFGRAGQMMANSQREQALKFELLVPITSSEKPTACVSFNYHQDHFGHLFGIRQANGEWAHTACVGFGLERIALALFRTHGFDPQRWPAPAGERLGI